MIGGAPDVAQQPRHGCRPASKPRHVSAVGRAAGLVLAVGADGSALPPTRLLRLLRASTRRALRRRLGPPLPTPRAPSCCARSRARRDFTLQLRATACRRQPAWLECAGRWPSADRALVCLLHDVIARRARARRRARAGRAVPPARRQRAGADRVLRGQRPADASSPTRPYAQRLRLRRALDHRHDVRRSDRRRGGAARSSRRSQGACSKAVPAILRAPAAAPDGGTRWIEVQPAAAPRRASGEAIGAFVLISDITKHRLAELAMRESEERLAKFMQASAEGIVFHKEGFITDANPPVCAADRLQRSRRCSAARRSSSSPPTTSRRSRR